jgi:serine/threonine-protein kinase
MTKPPPQIPNYEIIEKLGEGGMASVWLAQRDQDHRISVVKVLHDHLTSDTVVRSRFLREAQVASLLDHPYVAKLYDAGRAGEASYLAMEFIPGTDVETMMLKLSAQKKMLPPELSITVSLRVLEGLHYAHEFKDSEGRHLEIVHRDLSPRNVMVTFDGQVKIIDFGLVRTNLGDFRTAPGMIAGTLRYMSPEQATAERVDRRSDLYTWSVVLYELLSARPLVVATEARAILGAVVVDVPPPLSTKNPHLPKALDAVFAKALEKDAENRFHTALELRDALALAAGALGTASTQSISEFIGDLFPAEKLKATERLAHAEHRASEGPVVETTRVADSTEIPQPEPMPTPVADTATPLAFEPTVSDRPRPMPAKSRPKSKLPWIAAAAAVASLLAAVIVARPPEPVTIVEVASPPPPPHEQVTVAPIPIEQAKQAAKRPLKRTVKAPAKAKQTLEPLTPPPPPAEERVSTAELVARFNQAAAAKLGDKRGNALYTSCGLALAVAVQNEDHIRTALVECGRKLEAAEPN